MIEAALQDPDRVGDVLDGGGVIALRLEHLRRRCDDLLEVGHAVPILAARSDAGSCTLVACPHRGRAHRAPMGRAEEALMRDWPLGGFLCALAVLSATACTLAPEPDSAATMTSPGLPADARALLYWRTVRD